MAEKDKADREAPKPPKIKAEDNPWYLLATLYGVPEFRDDELQAKNRVAWNRYSAANLDVETRAKLIEEKRHPAEELTPFSSEESQEVAKAFAERCKESGKELALPASHDDIDFSNVQFGVSCARYLFSRRAAFFGAIFSGRADFGGATFSAEANFSGATFWAGGSFQGAAFSSGADFGGASFSGWANLFGASFSVGFFADASFSGGAVYKDATSVAEANFNRAAFSSWAFFGGAKFWGDAYFNGAAFFGEASFRTATFGRKSSFVNAEMRDETSFEGAIFRKEPPRFFEAKLHQGTVWRGIKSWPMPKDKNDAGAFVDFYACLKLEMDRLKKHEDELDFFALELQSRRVLLGQWRWGLPIALYGLLSDYGRSYFRPLVALFYLALIGTLAFLSSDSLSPLQSLGLSFTNSLNVFGFRKDFFDPSVIAYLPAWLDLVSAVQTILGTILLFLFGLGIRNKFRMQ